MALRSNLVNLTREEAEAVLAHEVSHIANGDMVTLALIQGVVNTFVFVLARVIGANKTSYEQAVASSSSAFKSWRLVPPPQRGEVVRQIGNAKSLCALRWGQAVGASYSSY